MLLTRRCMPVLMVMAVLVAGVVGRNAPSAAEIDRQTVTAFQWGVSGTFGLTMYIGGQSDTGNWVSIGYSGSASGIVYAGSWQCYDSTLQRRVGSVSYQLPGENQFWGEIVLGAVTSGYLQTRASVDDPWESTELNAVAPEFLQIFNEWETWRHHPGGGVILSAHPDSVLAWLDGWSYQEFSARAVTIPTNVPVAFSASQAPSPSGNSTSEWIGVPQDTPAYSFLEFFHHTLGVHNGIASQSMQWRSTNANDPQNPTRPYWTAGGTHLIQQSVPWEQINVTPIELIPGPTHSFSYHTKDIPGFFNSNSGGSSGFYNSTVQLIPLASNFASGAAPLATPAPSQTTEMAELWADKFETWRRSGPTEAYFSAGSQAWRVFFNGYVWDSHDQASFSLPDCGQPVPVSFSGNHLFINDRNGPQSPLNYTQSLGFRDDMTNVIFSLQADDTWYQGNVNIVFDPTPGNTLITWGTCGVNAYAMSTDPRIGSTTHLYVITPNAEVPATVQQSVTKLLTAYANYLNEGGYDFFDFLASGYKCEYDDPNYLAKVHDEEGSDDPCTDCPPPNPPAPGQGSTLGATDLQGIHSSMASFIDNHTFTYRHEAIDYDADPAASGCAPCGGGAAGMGAIPGTPYQRFHRYHDADAPSSLGPGVFDNFDISLTFGLGGDPMSWQYPAAWVMDPRMRYRVEMADYFDGIYRDWNRSTIQDLLLSDGAGNQAYGPENAVTATLSNHRGDVFRFEVIDTQAGTEATWAGRLTSITDRNGNAITCTYVFPRDATDAALGDDRGRLWQRSAITDAYGRSLTFTYRATPVAGRSVVERVDLPNGEHLTYTYSNGSSFSLEPLVGLTAVTYPNGDVSTFASAPESATQMVALTVADAGASGTHRNKTVFFSRPRFLTPEGDDLPQVPWRVRKVLNGGGETIYQNRFQDLGDGYAATLLIEGGRCSRYVSRYGKTLRSEVATNYVDGIDPADLTWELNETLALGAGDKVAQRTDILNRSRGFERNHPSGKPTRIDHPDGTYETTTYNDFAQVLTHRDRLGRQSAMTYDAQGNRLTRRVAIGTSAEALWSWTYNVRGQVTSETDPNGNTTDYVYFPAGHVWQYRLAEIIHPADDPTAEPGSEPTLRATESFAYDAAGRIRSSSDGEGRTTAFDYDERNRLEAVAYDDSSQELTTYGSGVDANLVTTRSDRNGNLTSFAYDGAGRRTGTTQAAGSPVAVTETCAYRPGTTLEEVCVRAGERTETTYDFRLRPVATTVFPRNDRSLITASVYDSAQRLAKRIDAFGRATYLVYDINDRIVRTVQEAIPGALDGMDVATVTRPTGTNPSFVIEESVFDAEGQVTARIDARGIRSTFQYDAQGHLSAQAEADARLLADGSWEHLSEAARTEMQYDPVGNVIAIRHPRSFVRDGSGAWINGPDGDFRTVRTYTARHRLTTETAAEGLDAASQPRPEQATRTWTYTLTGQIRSETDARGFTTTRAYTPCCNRLHTVTDSTGVIVATYAYDSHGNVLAVTDGNGLTTTQTYDARHRVRTRTNAAGETTTFTYDDDLTDGLGLDADPLLAAGLGFGPGATGSAIAVANPLGETGRQVQDGLGRAVRSVTPLGHATTTAHDLVVGDLVETTVTDPLGHTVRSRRDGLGRERQRIDALGIVALSIGSDASGNAITVRDAAGVGQDCVFDGRGRDIACTDTRGFTTTRTFDAHGNVVQATDADGRSTVAVFDARDRQTTVTDRLGAVTAFVYDASGNLLQLTDAEGGVTAYTYDARGLLVRELFPKGRATGTRANGTDNPTLPNTNQRSYTYDSGRRLATRLDQAEVTTTYVYDAANRLAIRAYPDATNDTFAYDAAGRLLVAISSRSRTTVERVYDAAGRLSEEWLLGQGPALAGAWKVAYGYDAADRLTTLIYPDGREVTRTYSPRQELATVTWAGQPIAMRTYDAAGRLTTTTLGNGLIETRSYTPGAHLIATIQVPGVTDFNYAYDGQNRKTAETDAVRPEWSQSFGYDMESRLTTWTRGEGVVPTQTQAWELTLVGDWQQTTKDGVAESRLHTPVHEVVRVGSAPLGYDKKGNLTRDEQGRRYVWDCENRLRRSRVFGAGSPTGYDLITVYHTDALGRRVAKVANGWVTRFLHAGHQVVQEEDGVAVEPLAVRTRDGDADVAAEDPATDLILDAATLGGSVTRISFQPETMANPPGFWSDKGRLFGERTNGLTYGWEVPLDSTETRRRLAHPLAEFDTFVRLRPSADRQHRWAVALPDGSYPVIIVAGDAISTKHTNHLLVNGSQILTDLTPWTDSPGYEQGNFDGWAFQALVVGGQLTIEAAPGARNPTLCWIAIGPQGALLPLDAQARLEALIHRVNGETWDQQVPTVQLRQYIYGSYVDEPVAFTRSHASGTDVTYLHANHLYSIAAATDAQGAVVERYRYTAYSARTVTDASGTVERQRSAIGQSRGFTGKTLDEEAGLYDFEARMYAPSLGRFISRDPLGYVDGMGLYSGYFMPNSLDPYGLCKVDIAIEMRDGDIGAHILKKLPHIIGAPVNSLPSNTSLGDLVKKNHRFGKRMLR